MISRTLKVVRASIHPIPHAVKLEDGTPVTATVDTLEIELVDESASANIVERIPAASPEIVAAFCEGAEIELTLTPKE